MGKHEGKFQKSEKQENEYLQFVVKKAKKTKTSIK